MADPAARTRVVRALFDATNQSLLVDESVREVPDVESAAHAHGAVVAG